MREKKENEKVKKEEMSLPSTPTYTFSIPSIHDRLRLDCRIYLPPDLPKRLLRDNSGLLRGAIIAHPYAPLGGCFDDPVVGVVGGEVLKLGCVVGTFNFRYVSFPILIFLFMSFMIPFIYLFTWMLGSWCGAVMVAD